MKRRPVAYEPHTVLTTSEVAAWLHKSERTVERTFASFMPGRYLVAHVLARIEELRRGRAPDTAPIGS